MCQKAGSFDGKAKQNLLKAPTLPSFFLEKPLYLLKSGKRLSIFYCKNMCTYKFYALTIKSALGNMSENSEFRFENSLKLLNFLSCDFFYFSYFWQELYLEKYAHFHVHLLCTSSIIRKSCPLCNMSSTIKFFSRFCQRNSGLG